MFIIKIVGTAYCFAGKYQPCCLLRAYIKFCTGSSSLFSQYFFINRFAKIFYFKQLPVYYAFAKVDKNISMIAPCFNGVEYIKII